VKRTRAKKTPPPPPPEPKEKHRITISLKQTEDPAADSALLASLNEVLKAYAGQDEVILRIENGTKIDVLRFPCTGYCPELFGQMAGIIGEERLKLETLPA
jgi:hypothetical protein